jgi:hypothetical protein
VGTDVPPLLLDGGATARPLLLLLLPTPTLRLLLRPPLLRPPGGALASGPLAALSAQRKQLASPCRAQGAAANAPVAAAPRLLRPVPSSAAPLPPWLLLPNTLPKSLPKPLPYAGGRSKSASAEPPYNTPGVAVAVVPKPLPLLKTFDEEYSCSGGC